MSVELFAINPPKLSRFHLFRDQFSGNSNIRFNGSIRNPIPETSRPENLTLTDCCLPLTIYNYLAYERYPLLPDLPKFLETCQHLGFDPGLVNYDEAPTIFNYFHIKFRPYQIIKSPLEIKPWLDNHGAFIALIWENNLGRLCDHQTDGDGHYLLVIGVDSKGNMLCLNSSIRGRKNTFRPFILPAVSYMKIAFDFVPVKHPYLYPDEHTIVPGPHTWLHAFGYLVAPGWT